MERENKAQAAALAAQRAQNQTFITDIDGKQIFSLELVNTLPNGKIQTANSMKYHSKTIKAKLGINFKFHCLRHTFATLSPENGMDVKTLSAMLGHVSAATTLDIYIHVTGDMQTEAAAKIDRGLGDEVLGTPGQAEQDPAADFQPVLGRKRKSGSGCITQINDHLFEGRYSPVWPDGTRHSKNIYAKTRKECEKKLKALIREMQAERQALIDQARGVTPPGKLTKTQKKLWTYMKFHPDVTSFRAIAQGAGVTRHTAAKWYEMIREMLGRVA